MNMGEYWLICIEGEDSDGNPLRGNRVIDEAPEKWLLSVLEEDEDWRYHLLWAKSISQGDYERLKEVL